MGRFLKAGAIFLLYGGIVVLIGVGITKCARAAEAWQPPTGMTWQQPGNNCARTSESYAIIQGCYFGNDTEHHAGAAFFRVCTRTRDLQPFLIVDYVHGGYIFRFENEKPEAGYFDPKNDGIDPVTFYKRIRDRFGECWYGNEKPI